ncbi:Low-density lipoprotein receptor, partial [Trichoplax sp. H2]
ADLWMLIGEVLCNRENAQCYEGQCTATSQYCNAAIQCNKTTLIGAAGCVPDQCQPSQFKCNNGLCIPSHNWCNFQYNCEDMSDEQNCNKITFIVANIKFLILVYPKCNQFTEIKCQSGQCISRVLRCDGYNDCYDGSDEEYCGMFIPILCE